MHETNENPEVTQGTENNVTEKSNGLYAKYFPNWYKNMSIKSKLISLFIILLVSLSGGYAAFYYAKLFITQHIPEITGVGIFVLVAYLLPKTDAWKSFMQ